jgi:DNA repair exonuclease SbcCD ATPase subunit
MAKTKRTKAGKGFAQVKSNHSNAEMMLSAASEQGLAAMATQVGMAPSELVEHLVKGKIAVLTDTPETTISVTPHESASQSPTVEVVSGEKTRNQQGESAAQLRALEEQIAEQNAQMTKLKKELAQQENLEQNYQTISLQSQQQSIYIDELEAARSRQRQEIQELNHRLNQVQSQLNIQANPSQTEIAAKDQQIAELQAQVQALQSFASIGEKQLNRWRSRSIE